MKKVALLSTTNKQTNNVDHQIPNQSQHGGSTESTAPLALAFRPSSFMVWGCGSRKMRRKVLKNISYFFKKGF